jgi:hypothetical protein
MNSYESLLLRVRQVRRRWRSQVLVKGVSLFLVSAIALLVLGVWGADLFGFKPAAVWVMRCLTGGTVLFVAWYFLYLPLRVRVSDVQVAQFIEERYPQLEDRLVAAVEYGSQQAEPSSMIDLLIRDALDKARRVDFSIFLNRRRLAFFGVAGIAAICGLVALLTWETSFFPYGFRNLYAPWTEASIGSFMSITLVPEKAEIVKGADQLIRAQLHGFDSPDVRLYLQPDSSSQWNASVMEPDHRGSTFRYLLLDIRSSLRFYVESKGIRSQIGSLNVIDRAKVDKIDLTYNFPAYTGMPPQVIENEGDISALKGTKINLKIRLDGAAESAHLLFDDQSTVSLTRINPREFSGNFSLQRSGSYVVRIAESLGKTYPGSSEYEMEALDDAAPKVSIARPMRDVRATSVEEVFSEVKADDDIGMGKLELHYSVNGAPEKAVSLYKGKPSDPSITASHTFFLEDFGLQPGDMISYYAKAWDNNNVTGPGNSSSDMYFIQVRPFEQKYIQNQQGSTPGSSREQGQQGQQGQGNESQDALSKQQKEIISATFNLIRDKDRIPSKEYLEGLKSLALVQGRLQTQAQTLVDRIQRRGAEEGDEDFGKLSEYLKNAIGEMRKAVVDLGGQKPETAMPPEQKSLQQLLRAESLFRQIQVSFAAQNPGESSAQTNAEDLADLFELEMNKLKNQYETMQRGEQQARDQKVDEALQRLKELAKRQQQQNERNRMMAQQGMPPGSSPRGNNNQSQQQLMEQAEQLRRQLQRLSRERSSPQLEDAGNQLQKAIDEMKKSLNAQNRSGSETNAQGQRALQQLEDAARKLAQGQETGLKQGVERAVNESKKLVEEQDRIQEALNRMAKQPRAATPSNEDTRGRDDLVSRKTTLADRVKNLGNQIQDLSRQARKTQKEASNRLADASDAIQENRLPERIMGGNALIQNGFYESQQPRENQIRNGLEEVNRQLRAAQNSMGRSSEGKMEEAANRARQLAEGLESMQQRMRGMQGSQSQGDRSGNQSARGRQGVQQQGDRSGNQSGMRGQQGGQPQGDRSGDQSGMRGQQGGQPQGDRSGNQSGMRGQQGGQQQGDRSGNQSGMRGQQGGQPQGDRSGDQSAMRGQQGGPQQGDRSGDQSGMRGQQGGQPQAGQQPGRGMDQGLPQDARGLRGQNPQDRFGGRPDASADIQGPTANSFGPPTGFGEDERQLSREFQQRLMDAQDLRRLLDRNSAQMEDLEKAIESLRRADSGPVSPEQIASLKAAIDYMRRIELNLARALENQDHRDKYLLTEDNEAPNAYKKLVDEYYKALSKNK